MTLSFLPLIVLAVNSGTAAASPHTGSAGAATPVRDPAARAALDAAAARMNGFESRLRELADENNDLKARVRTLEARGDGQLYVTSHKKVLTPPPQGEMKAPNNDTITRNDSARTYIGNSNNMSVNTSTTQGAILEDATDCAGVERARRAREAEQAQQHVRQQGVTAARAHGSLAQQRTEQRAARLAQPDGDGGAGLGE